MQTSTCHKGHEEAQGSVPASKAANSHKPARILLVFSDDGDLFGDLLSLLFAKHVESATYHEEHHTPRRITPESHPAQTLTIVLAAPSGRPEQPNWWISQARRQTSRWVDKQAAGAAPGPQNRRVCPARQSAEHHTRQQHSGEILLQGALEVVSLLCCKLRRRSLTGADMRAETIHFRLLRARVYAV